jgi:hypothetical protein
MSCIHGNRNWIIGTKNAEAAKALQREREKEESMKNALYHLTRFNLTDIHFYFIFNL